eukprot:1332855-Amphidinium_carterae.1
MKYVQAQASGGDSAANTLLNECLVNLELTKEKTTPASAWRCEGGTGRGYGRWRTNSQEEERHGERHPPHRSRHRT